MKIKQEEFDKLLIATGSPTLNLSTHLHKQRPAVCQRLATWFFVRQEPESEVTQFVREYLLEIDSNGYVKWEQD